jgi:hypothetical protein
MMFDILQARPQVQSLMLAAAFLLLIDRERRQRLPRVSYDKTLAFRQTAERQVSLEEQR